MKSGIWIKLQSDNKNDKNPAGNGVTVVPQDFVLTPAGKYMGENDK